MVTPLVKHKIIKKRTLRFRRYQSDRKVTVKVSDGRIVNTKHRDARGGKTRGFAKKRREKRQGEAGLLNGGRGFFPREIPSPAARRTRALRGRELAHALISIHVQCRSCCAAGTVCGRRLGMACAVQRRRV